MVVLPVCRAACITKNAFVRLIKDIPITLRYRNHVTIFLVARLGNVEIFFHCYKIVVLSFKHKIKHPVITI